MAKRWRTCAAPLLLCLLPLSAHAQQWQARRQLCGAYAERTFCAGKAGCPSWQWTSECVAQQATPRLASCVAMVAQRRKDQHQDCALCGDAVRDVAMCMGWR